MKAKLITQKTEVKLGHIVFLQELSTNFSEMENNSASVSLSATLKNYSEVKKSRVLARVLIKFKLID
jgi:hypothetical protein